MSLKQQTAQARSRQASSLIEGLINLQIKNGIAQEQDRIFLRNSLLGLVGEENYVFSPVENLSLEGFFTEIANIAIRNSKISLLELSNFLDRLGGVFAPLPSLVNRTFSDLIVFSSKKATQYLMDISKFSYYVKSSGDRNLSWQAFCKYGKLFITINTSKPEKSLDEISKAASQRTFTYPKCHLCIENVGHHSSLPGGSRLALRSVDLKLCGESYFMHFSPYGYFSDHLVVNSYEHKPMNINKNTALQILSFVELFPHYFLASNSDIPIVGGSILSHQHFQGGNQKFPIQDARAVWSWFKGDSKIQILFWPIPAIRITGTSKEKISEIFEVLRMAWYGYENPSIGVFAKSPSGKRQNAISVFGAAVPGGSFELYVLLRNNSVSEKFPGGVFHVHPERWNIKKENIGVIEQIGMAVLPGRLAKELIKMGECFADSLSLPAELSHHDKWFKQVKASYKDTSMSFVHHLELCVSQTFERALEDCSVFKSKTLNHLKKFIFSSLDLREK